MNAAVGRRLLKAFLALLLVVALVAASAWVVLHRSLPPLAGQRSVAGVAEPVRIERDGQGVPTLRAASRGDLAFATGFVHGQDRFFQMDLLRRAAAGELSELLGPAARGYDTGVRVHRFRWRARRALEQGDPAHLAIVAAYAQGVNAGRRSLGARPFEYFLLRCTPTPWLPEDSYLVLFAMYLDLQDDRGRRDAMRGVLSEVLSPEMVRFLWPAGTLEWDAPIAGAALPMPPIPGPQALDFRGDEKPSRGGVTPAESERGSNNWAVAGAHTAHGGAMLANDMHLGLGVPNIWYRAVLSWTDEGTVRTAMGVTLPGAPVLVVGSNGTLAWGFTNSYGDYSDLVVLEIDPERSDRYRTPRGWRSFATFEEIVRVKGAPADTVRIRETLWGPVIDEDFLGRPRALRWVAHDAAGANLGLLGLEAATTVDEALDIANRCGVPAQNFVVAHRDGRIGWTVLGRVPRRVGCDGSVPVSWAEGTCGWDGYLEPGEVPRVVDPAEGRIWTANARVVDGEAMHKIGDGGYALGARAQQIRDDLRALSSVTEQDMLAVQVDDRAVFLTRWQRLMLTSIPDDARYGELRGHVEEWGGRAGVESVGYRLVRTFRNRVHETVLGALTRPCVAADSTFSATWMPRSEGPVWALVTERPAHLLPSPYTSWESLLQGAVQGTLEDVTEAGGLPSFSWGARNLSKIGHPLGRAVPFLGRWLDMTPRPLPGDSYMPRVQHPSSGASQRMVVSPGREEDGIFHMPGGQSGHPLSPHYRDGHAAWENAVPTPLLPGPAAHTLVLLPRDLAP